MLEDGQPPHLALEDLIAYVGRHLDPARVEQLEEHLADCDSCAARALHARRSSRLVDGWAASSVSRARQQAAVLTALVAAKAAPQNAAWQERLTNWLDRWAGRVEGAVRIALKGPEDVSQVLLTELAFLARPDALWPQFAAERPMRGATSAPTVVTPQTEGPRARVEVAGDTVVVRVDGLGTVTPPLVMLIPDGRMSDALIAELVADRAPEATLGDATAVTTRLDERALEPSAWLARFARVPPGNYLLAFEPQPPLTS